MGIRLKWVLAPVVALLVVGCLWWLIPRPPLFEGLGFTTALYDRQEGLLRLPLAGDDHYRIRVPLAGIAPEMVEATLLYEDRAFHRHPGVNPLALLRAGWRTYIQGGRREGGSTLTMQLARHRFGIRTHNIRGKVLQILRALQLERHYTKGEILEAYLTLAPYGGNIEGVGAASLIYFGKPAARLTLPEALTLSVIPQSPNRHRPYPTLPGGEPEALVAARARLFKAWLEVYPQDVSWRDRMERPVASRARVPLPFKAPHFTTSLLERGLRLHDPPAGEELLAASGALDSITPNESGLGAITTLDPVYQDLLERQVSAYVARNRIRGLHNAAALLVHTRDLEVRALVGSANFFDEDIDGQVDGTSAPRSPGSALKPFLYGMAFDQGLVHPHSVLKDAPVGYGIYDPENFDGDFQGPITAREALIRSRNIPALHLAERLAPPGFHRLLAEAGIGGLRTPEHYGLAVVLGGMEITMREIVALYAILGNGGIHRPLRFFIEAPIAEGRRLLSPEAAAMVLDILKDNPRDAGVGQGRWARNPLDVHWKTGTSYAYRDAWAVGLFGSYVLAVWVGNFDGRGNPALIGREAAAPLFFSIVDALHALEPGMRPLPRPKGLNLRKVAVCASSGGIPGPHCPATVKTWFIPGVSPILPDTVYREVAMDAKTGLRACPGSGVEVPHAVYEFWPSDLLEIYQQAGIPRKVPPPYPKGCAWAGTGGLPPQITSPKDHVVYQVRGGRREPILLRAVSDADVRQLYWFLDTRYLGVSHPGGVFFLEPQPGRFQLRVVDDQGRSDVRSLEVKMAD